MSCKQFKSEVARLTKVLDNDDGNTGVTFVLIPGMIEKEVRTSKNQKTINERLSHISNLYFSKRHTKKSGNNA